MPARLQLTPTLVDAPFRVGDALLAGVTPSRLRNADLDASLHGVRSATPITDHVALCRAYLVRLRPGLALTGLSAAILLGIPVPAALAEPRSISVGAPDPSTPPRANRVVGIRVRPDLWSVGTARGVPVTAPLTTWTVLARHLTVIELVTALDAILASSPNYPGESPRRPLASSAALEALVPRLRGVTGAAALRAAAAMARTGVESPMESVLRVLLVEAGFPEPEVNGLIVHADGRRVRADLVYRDARIAIEYEGDVHREPRRFRRDITRARRLGRDGWVVLRVTVEDLRAAAFAELCADLSHALAAR